ncbi:MAG TPA: FUSC family protein [Acetobacteraceae bacterium]|nr:FUSC family protein [Acetobacteraceae bacterium]
MVAHRLRALASIDRGGWSLARGLRAGLGCSVPLLLAEWLHEPALSWAALIGFWVALVDPGWPPRTRLRAILFFIAGTASGCFLAVLVRPHLLISATFALLWCFAAILTRVWGDAAGSAGNLLALAVLIVLGLGGPSSLHAAIEIAAFTLAGGLWGMALAFAIGRGPPDAPLRAALASVFRAEAAFVRDMIAPPPRLRPGAVREAIERARAMLDRPAQWPRFVLMLGDAERVLRALLALRELSESAPTEAVPLESLGAMAARLDEIAAAVQGRATPAPRPLALPEAGAAARAFGDALAWIDAASERLAAAAAGAAGFAGVPPADDRARYFDQLRNNLTLDSLSFRHAARFAVTGAALTLITNGLHLEMGYWITLTAVIILQAYPSATWQRAIQRVGGSIAGGLVAVGAAFILHGPAAMTLVIIPLSVLAMAFRSASYAIYILCITPLFILITELFDKGGVIAPSLGGLRILDNLAGASLGLLATFVLWPSWEGRYLRRRLANDVSANGDFLIAALDARMGRASDEEVEAARRRAGLAGNNAEASLRRALQEPRRHPSDEIAAAMTIAAAARRLAGIAAVIAQTADAGPDLSERRERLRIRLDQLASAIAEASPPAAAEAPPPGLVGQQLAVLDEAARALATPQPGAALLSR